MQRSLKLIVFLGFMLSIFFSLRIILEAKVKEELPRIPGATLLLGWGDVDKLQATTPSRTVDVLDQTDSGYSTPHYPSISRDGKVIACIRHKSRNPQRVAVATFSISDSKWSEYAESDYVDAVSISPDASRLAFLIHDPDSTSIHLHIVDTETRKTMVLPSVDPQGSLSWDHDGRRLVYQSGSGPDAAIDVVDITSGKTSKIAKGGNPSWAPSGEWIAYINRGENQCILTQPDGTGSRVLVTLRQGRFQIPGWLNLPPVWSPDSSKLLLDVVQPEGRPPDIVMFDVMTQRRLKSLRSSVPVLGWAESK